MNKITIGLILIIGTLLIVNSNWFSEIKTEKSNESYVISSGNVIEIGDKYKDGYYDVSYTNKDTKQGGTFGEYDFHSGDVVHGMEYTKGNKISYELNEGYFKLTSTIFKNSITEINKPGNYYLKKDLKKTTYEVCNKGTLNVDTNLGFL